MTEDVELEVFKAVPFGSDGTDGDSAFSLNEAEVVDATTECTFEHLLEVWARKVAAIDHEGVLNVDGTVSFKDDDGETWTMGGEELIEWIGEEDQNGDLPVGFWLLTEEALRTVRLLDLVDAYGDRDGYVIIRAQKTIANHLASSVVGDRSPLDG